MIGEEWEQRLRAKDEGVEIISTWVCVGISSNFCLFEESVEVVLVFSEGGW